jgi:hypothetical protein
MPIRIPNSEQQESFFRDRLEPGERIESTFWCEQRLPLLLHMLVEQAPMGSIIFSKMRHRYFVALTDRRLLIMGSTGMHDPIPEKFETIPLTGTTCPQFHNWLGHVAMDISVNARSAGTACPALTEAARRADEVAGAPGLLTRSAGGERRRGRVSPPSSRSRCPPPAG